jgi:hypothetical protein
MFTKHIEVSSDELQMIARVDSSVQHWSLEHTQLTIRAQEALAQAHSMYATRKQLLDRLVQGIGLDAAKVVRGQLSQRPDGTAMYTVMMDEEPGNESDQVESGSGSGSGSE